MMKKLIILLACLGMSFQTTSCTSKDSHADAEVAADVDSADLEKLEGEGAGQIADENSLSSDQLPEEALGESAPKPDIAQAPEAPISDVPATDVAATPEALPPDPFAESSVASTPPVAEPAPADNTKMVESTTRTESTTTIVDSEPVKKPSAPLQKIASAPFKVGKTWFNAVYFARPGDTLSGISTMIYGADKTKELKKGNATFKSRDVRPGDKVYYNSPNRPDDATRLLTYYEENGVAPETYVAKSGDNLRKISKQLLGYDGAWKEVWASNSVDSKGALDEGTELRYWKGGGVAAAPAPAASATPAHQEVAAAPPAPQEAAIPQEAMGEIPPPPMPEQQQAGMDMPPPPPPEMPAEQVPPPPPPPVQAVNPPPPPAPEAAEEATTEHADQDTTMALAVVGLAAAGLAVLIVMRKKRKQRELDQSAMDNTHVGT